VWAGLQQLVHICMLFGSGCERQQQSSKVATPQHRDNRSDSNDKKQQQHNNRADNDRNNGLQLAEVIAKK